jgi:hypothetical protein
MIQPHIHLGISKTSAPENAPLYALQVNTPRPKSEVYLSFEHSLDGYPHLHVLTDTNGIPMNFIDYQYDVISHPSTGYGYDVFLEISKYLGQPVWFVDNFHCPDGADHTPYIKNYVLVGIEFLYEVNPNMSAVAFRVVLKDASTGGNNKSGVKSPVTIG